MSISEVLSQEQSLVRRFVEELGLSLEWYKYITTGRRDFIEDFSKFVKVALSKVYEHPKTPASWSKL